MTKAARRNKISPDANVSQQPDPNRPHRDNAPQALLVLGMHRNGTSALTRVFNLLGADLPKNLLGSNPTNEAGHWESNDLLAIHDELLSSAGSHWDDWRAFNPEWYKSPVAEAFKQKLLDQLEGDFGGSHFFVVKDPRACRFVPLWLDVLERFGAETRVVIPLRNPIEVAASLKKRDGFLLAKSYLLWLRHVLDAEHATRNVPRAVITYDALIDDWRGTVGKIAERTNLHWPRRSDQTELEIENFLVGRLRHHVADPDQLGVRADIVDWVKSAYLTLRDMAEGRESSAEYERLDTIRAEFDKASAAFGLVLAGETANRAASEAETARLSGQLKAAAEHERAYQQELKSARTVIQERDTAIRERDTTIQERDAEIQRRDAEISQLSREAAEQERAYQQELESARTVIQERDAEIQQRDAEVSQLSREVDRTQKFLRDSQTELQRISGEIDEARRALSHKSGEFDAIHREFGLRGQQIVALATELRSVRKQTAELKAELVRLNEIAAASILARLKRYWRSMGGANASHQWDYDAISMSGLFDAQWYLEQHPDVTKSGMDPLWHYVLHGAAERRNPHPLFDTNWYLSQAANVAELNMTPLGHYVSIGASVGLDPHPLFDTSWYLEQYLDVAAAGENPLYHYVAHGAQEGRNPNPQFNTAEYASLHPELAETGVNPLIHHAKHMQSNAAMDSAARDDEKKNGLTNVFPVVQPADDETAIETRRHASALSSTEESPMFERAAYRAITDSGLFDADYYLRNNADVAAAKLNPLRHFMGYGAYEGRNPNPWFDTKWYTRHYPDIGQNRINPLLHYLLYGAQEGRDPSPWFSTVDYFIEHPGLAEAKVNPLVHYLASGATKLPDSLQPMQILQDNAGRVVKVRELTDLIDFPPRALSPAESAYNPSSLDIHWLVPDFTAGGGGIMTILRIVRLLEQFGHRCTVWIVRPSLNKNERSAAETALRHYQTVKAPIKFLSSEFFELQGDAVIGTSWETVVFAMHATGFKERFYFVQDYEPAFFATGALSLAAEWTYQNDLACICASPWLAEKLEKTYGRWTKAGWLAADLDVYRPPDEVRNHSDVPKIAFYARRYTERRAVDLGLLALEYLAKKGVQFHVDFFGMPLAVSDLPYSFTDHGVLSEAELAALYQRSDVGIVFSSTNYSLVPQEMMASGLAVLELDGESTRRIYPEDTITLAGPHPLNIGDALEKLLADPDRRQRQAHAALTWVREFSWEKFARVAENAILERLQEKGFSPEPKPSMPHLAREAPKASVLIPTYNGGQLFERVLHAIKTQRTPWPFEIIVIDSESTDGTAEFAAKSDGVVFQPIQKREFQHGRTRNRGIELAAGEYVALVTQDALPANDFWLYNMITTMERYPKAAGAFGRHIAYPDASPFLKRDMTDHFASFNAYPMAVSKYTSYRNWTNGDNGWRQMLHFFSDNNSCVRKSVWQAIPYPNIDYGEDQVWAAQIIEAGYEKLYVSSATVVHSHNYTVEEMFERSAIEGHFFKTYFNYDLVPARSERLLEQHIASANAHDELWALANGVDGECIALQRKLNEAKFKGMWKGMKSANYIGHERDWPASGSLASA